MVAPRTREEFSSYCLRKLGEPVITVDVAVEQIEDRIDEALSMFYERNYEAVEEVFLLHDITAPVGVVQEDSNGVAILDSAGAEIPILDTAGNQILTTDTDVEKGYLQLPNDIVGVTNVFRPIYAGGIAGGGANFEFYVNDIYRNILPGAGGSGGLSYYYMYQSQLTLLNRYFNPEKQYDYNPLTNKLIIAGGLRNSDTQYGGLIIRGFRELHGQAETDDPAGTVIHNIWKSRWLQNYAGALIKKQWASNYYKHQSIQLLGGVTMNGEGLMSAALAEIEQLEQELKDTYELPPSFLIG